MERLQWGFPIATALSLNMPTSINGKEKNKDSPRKDTEFHGIRSVAVEAGRQASEAKGPFSRREEGWELGERKRK